MINLSFIGRETLEILCTFFHKAKVIYTINMARLPRIKIASPIHPFGEQRDKPSPERRQQNLDRLVLRTMILAQHLEYGLVQTWMEGTRDKLIAEGTARPVLRDTTPMTTSSGPIGSSTTISRSEQGAGT